VYRAEHSWTWKNQRLGDGKIISKSLSKFFLFSFNKFNKGKGSEKKWVLVFSLIFQKRFIEIF